MSTHFEPQRVPGHVDVSASGGVVSGLAESSAMLVSAPPLVSTSESLPTGESLLVVESTVVRESRPEPSAPIDESSWPPVASSAESSTFTAEPHPRTMHPTTKGIGARSFMEGVYRRRPASRTARLSSLGTDASLLHGDARSHVGRVSRRVRAESMRFPRPRRSARARTISIQGQKTRALQRRLDAVPAKPSVRVPALTSADSPRRPEDALPSPESHRSSTTPA